MRALILVDIQNDFAPTGALPVPEGDQVVPVVNKLQEKFELVVATQDWHPEDHKSFAIHHNKKPGEVIQLNGRDQILWPVHCVQGTKGAEFISGLNMDKVARVFKKGMDPEVDSYSGFFDNDHKTGTGLMEYLREQGVDEVYIAGLALDVCVKFTAMDARSLGFKTFLVEDATRGVDVNEGDSEQAMIDMKAAGIFAVTSDQV